MATSNMTVSKMASFYLCCIASMHHVVPAPNMKIDSRFSWELTFCTNKWRGRYNFLAECVILHCRKGICAWPPKRTAITWFPGHRYFVWLGTVNALAQQRRTAWTGALFCELLEKQSFTNTDNPRCHVRTSNSRKEYLLRKRHAREFRSDDWYDTHQTIIASGLSDLNGCPYPMHSEGVRQIYPIFNNCNL